MDCIFWLEFPGLPALKDNLNFSLGFRECKKGVWRLFAVRLQFHIHQNPILANFIRSKDRTYKKLDCPSCPVVCRSTFLWPRPPGATTKIFNHRIKGEPTIVKKWLHWSPPFGPLAIFFVAPWGPDHQNVGPHTRGRLDNQTSSCSVLWLNKLCQNPIVWLVWKKNASFNLKLFQMNYRGCWMKFLLLLSLKSPHLDKLFNRWAFG